MLKIALICGGPSPERGISLNSARSVMDHLDDLNIQIIPPRFYLRTAKIQYDMSLFDKLNKAKMDKLKANLEEGLAFLEENKKRPEVTALQSGLQYEVIKMGEGPKPAATNTVTCHYHGMLIDGRVFDSSVQRGQPASFPLNRVISGWTEALQLMPIGSKWKLFLPPHLAYGEQQAGALIGPNSTLIFEVELLGF